LFRPVGLDLGIRSDLFNNKVRTMPLKKSEMLQPPVHPGEILREDFMKPLGLSVNKLALDLHVPATRIGEIVHERRRITADTSLRLARYFKTNAEFWLNLQNFFDLEQARRCRCSIRDRTPRTPARKVSILGTICFC
jgi:addiction module HigA family antidote